MRSKIETAVASVKKTADTAKETIRESAAYAAIYPDSAVSKAYHTAHAVLDPAGFVSPAVRFAMLLAAHGVPVDAGTLLILLILHGGRQ